MTTTSFQVTRCSCLHHAEVGCVSDVSEEYIASIIRADVTNLGQEDGLYRNRNTSGQSEACDEER